MLLSVPITASRAFWKDDAESSLCLGSHQKGSTELTSGLSACYDQHLGSEVFGFVCCSCIKLLLALRYCQNIYIRVKFLMILMSVPEYPENVIALWLW